MGNPKKKGGRVTPKKPPMDLCGRRSMAYGRKMEHLFTTRTVTSVVDGSVKADRMCNWCGLTRPFNEE